MSPAQQHAHEQLQARVRAGAFMAAVALIAWSTALTFTYLFAH